MFTNYQSATGAHLPSSLLQIHAPQEKIVEYIGWWLCLTEQGMWNAQLQQAEETLGKQHHF